MTGRIVEVYGQTIQLVFKKCEYEKCDRSFHVKAGSAQRYCSATCHPDGRKMEMSSHPLEGGVLRSLSKFRKTKQRDEEVTIDTEWAEDLIS